MFLQGAQATKAIECMGEEGLAMPTASQSSAVAVDEGAMVDAREDGSVTVYGSSLNQHAPGHGQGDVEVAQFKEPDPKPAAEAGNKPAQRSFSDAATARACTIKMAP
jgi:hypothetical protein